VFGICKVLGEFCCIPLSFLVLNILPSRRCKGLLLHLIGLIGTHKHTHTLGKTPLDKGSVRRRELGLNHTILTTDRQPYLGGIPSRNSSKRATSDSSNLAIPEVVFIGFRTFRLDREGK